MVYRSTENMKDIAMSEAEILKQIKDLAITDNHGKKVIELTEIFGETSKKVPPVKGAKLLYAIQKLLADEINLILSIHAPMFYVCVARKHVDLVLRVFRKRQWWFDEEVARLKLRHSEKTWIMVSEWTSVMSANEEYKSVDAMFPVFAACVLKIELHKYLAEVKLDAVLKAIEEESA